MKNEYNSRQRLLRAALVGNAIFSTVSGLAILLAHRKVVAMLGLPPGTDLSFVAIGLLVFAAALVWSAIRPDVKVRDAQIAIVLDVAWVVLSWVAVVFGPFNTQGKWIVAAVAEIVLLFSILQWIGIRRSKRGEKTPSPAI